MKKVSCMCSSPGMKNFGLLALRIAVALVFITAGWAKLGDMTATVAAFGDMGVPLAGFSAWLVALVEFAGGIGILLGIFTKFWSALLAITMIVALLLVHLGGTLAEAQTAITMLGATLALFTHGAGDWRLVKKECPCELKK
jgi:putative oxidoreductase